jgi:hypothetical protein
LIDDGNADVGDHAGLDDVDDAEASPVARARAGAAEIRAATAGADEDADVRRALALVEARLAEAFQHRVGRCIDRRIGVGVDLAPSVPVVITMARRARGTGEEKRSP